MNGLAVTYASARCLQPGARSDAPTQRIRGDVVAIDGVNLQVQVAHRRDVAR